MENKKSIPIISLAIFSIVILLAYGNIEKVYAVTLTSNEPDTTFETVTQFGYNSNFDYLVTIATEGAVYHVHVVEGDTLTQVADITTVLTSGGISNTDGIVCSATLCFVWGQSGANAPTVVRINMVTLAVSVTYAEPEYGGCSITNFEFFGTNIYATMADLGGCPYTGFYSLSTGFTSDVASNIQWIEYDSATATGDTSHNIGSCIIEGRYFIMGTTGAATDIRKYDLSTKTLSDSASLGAVPTELHCDTSFSSGYVYVTSIAGDWVKRVKISDLSIEADQMTVTNPRHVMQRGDSIYVSRSDSTTVTVGNKDNLASQFVMFTGLAHNDIGFFKGNATRFNMVAPSTNDNIFYSVDGVFDEEEEEAPSDTACFDINDSPETVQLVCYPDVDGDGFPDLPGGVFGGLNPTRNVTSSAQFLAEQLGLVEEGSDIRFNGVGYMIVAVGLGILIAMFFLASGGDLHRIPTFVWFIGTLAIVGAFAGFGFVDITFFIIGILVIIALASAKILSTLELGGFK